MQVPEGGPAPSTAFGEWPFSLSSRFLMMQIPSLGRSPAGSFHFFITSNPHNRPHRDGAAFVPILQMRTPWLHTAKTSAETCPSLPGEEVAWLHLNVPGFPHFTMCF